jgi:hypothetical protein
MRKKMLVALIATVGALSVFAVASATAGLPTNTQSGSKAYVSDFSGGTCNPIESNKISQGSTLYLISNQNVTLDWTLSSQGTSSKTSTFWTSGQVSIWTLCAGATNLWYASIGTASEALGTYTVQANYDSSGKNFSSDSFQIVAAAV